MNHKILWMYMLISPMTSMFQVAMVSNLNFYADSFYLTAQYVSIKNGMTPDWELNHFKDIYAKVRQLNSGFAKRLRETKGNDEIISALVRLDMFAQGGSFLFSEKWLKRLEPISSAYLDR